MRDAIILIFANKQDVPGGNAQNSNFIPLSRSNQCALINKTCQFPAMKPHEIQEKLGLTRIRDRNWYVQPSCATTGDGLYEGLTWLTSNHKL